ncbi:hypothetical protein AGMMS49953_03090 [Endomicrobiia bacterium]|uniref:hypothetical protein n=1 Tax=Endomicrobium trichonymphae TaxID=1408204 RepID=UPI000BBABB0A|nr:hypothetical protein [Candidatus Endomicrobium trichonymphae]GHT23101.1 hypothetical protein AGMMS49953_03090 [Endomicrobiia bacterium]
MFSTIAGIGFAAVFVNTDIFVILFFGLVFKEGAKRRKELIARQLPLSVMLDAVLDFYGVAEKVTQILQEPLANEFKNA